MPAEKHALTLIKTLRDAGHETRFVGGCVRDAVLGRKIADIDLASTATPDEVTAALTKAGIRVEPTGLAHGTVTAVIDGMGIEITTLREDVETDGRHARVIFTKDWEKDARRRDFTLNAMFRDAEGKIHDFVGGWQDAQDGYIRFVGDARARIKEDYLRVLRFFRFQATHGKALPDEETLAACHAAAAHLKDLSRERIWKELKKLLAAPNPHPAWKMMSEAGVAQKILPEAHGFRLEQLAQAEKTFSSVAGDPILRLAALVYGDKTEAEALAQRFALSQKEARDLGIFLDFQPEKAAPFSPKKVHALAYLYSTDIAGKFLLLAAVFGAQFDWESAAKVLEKTRPQSFPLKGEDLLALGISPGPRVGEI
ncbi:MAG TPA: CCA tRNA nucleotidyltransferase, partial [Alphaproteobacteria bacterium]|nr:CCA tRNA nucleotidyltransferase [Alphaproteobacteria bacterium]